MSAKRLRNALQTDHQQERSFPSSLFRSHRFATSTCPARNLKSVICCPHNAKVVPHEKEGANDLGFYYE